MTPPDLEYVRRRIAAGVVASPVLEMGTGYAGETCRAAVEAAGLTWFGTDLEPGPGVSFAADFERPEDVAAVARAAGGRFGSVLVLNVLEHTFDPIRVLDNAATLVRPGGSLVVLTPAVWPLHDYPMDCWRPLPNFYEEYARRRGLELAPESFEYVGYGPVADYRNPDGSYRFPPPASGLRRLWSRAVHRVANTYARGMFQPSHLAVGAAFVTPR